MDETATNKPVLTDYDGMKESIKQEFLRTLDERTERLSKVRNLGIVPFGVFGAPSVECMDLFRDGHYYGCISLVQAVTEAIIRHVWQVKSHKNKAAEGEFKNNLAFLHKKRFIDDALKNKIDRIWKDRHLFHHLNLKVEAVHQRLEQLAEEKLGLLADVEKHFFDNSVDNGILNLTNPEFWNVNQDGEVLVYVRPVSEKPLDFIRQIVVEDNKTGKWDGRVHTRFPPEPNGYLHVGHAKSICLNFGIAEDFGGLCNLRFDDTNPEKEDVEYVDSIQRDIRWLGFDWGDRLYYASDYFDQLYEWAVQLIQDGKAYVDSQSLDEIRANRGTSTEPGKESPYRNRPVEENLDLFERMKAGEFEDGAHVLRARIDMGAKHLILRDPIMYRIRHAHHHRTGDKWCIYPMYDFTHGQSDSIEKITHSICTLEFENHRPLYDWYCEALGIYHPQQIEFARLKLTYTITSKRKLLELVQEGRVSGWDDPRMPTVCGLRRRGYTPEAIRNFCDTIGVTKFNSSTDMVVLENSLREDLNKRACRVMGVLNPLKVVIENYPHGETEQLDAVNNPEDASAGTRKVPFSKTLYIEREDFMEEPPKKFYRLAPGREVRLRYAYFITCTDVIKDDNGKIVELRCTYDPATRGGDAPDGRKVKATLHWVSADHAMEAEVRLYDHLFQIEDPLDVEDDQDWKVNLNPNSLQVIPDARLEPSLKDAEVGSLYQFERLGYFCVDPDSTPEKPVFNRAVTLRDTWARVQKQSGKT